jgi:hypothetical protein
MGQVMAAHTSFKRGQPIYVQLKSGEQFRDKFLERRSAFVILMEHGKVANDKLRAISIDRKPVHG